MLTHATRLCWLLPQLKFTVIRCHSCSSNIIVNSSSTFLDACCFGLSCPT
jgi:hypothetical protein